VSEDGAALAEGRALALADGAVFAASTTNADAAAVPEGDTSGEGATLELDGAAALTIAIEAVGTGAGDAGGATHA
jgi:hypothetical protein